MALLRVGGFNSGKRREELLSSYDGEEPYMPGGYETPYNGEEPYLPEGYDGDYDGEAYDDYDDGDYDGDYGYGEPYGDGSRYDDDYGYDEAYGYDEDGYPPEGADYDRAPYYVAPEYADGPEYPAGWLGELLRYLDENDWVTWLTLLLLPPVGIWLLWRRRRYLPGVNAALTAVSLLWVAAIAFVLLAKPFRPAGDTTITPQPVGAAALPEQSAEDGETGEDSDAQAAAELIPAEEVDEANAVYVVVGTPYYHQSQECQNLAEGAELTRLSRNTAIEQSLMACPYCMAGQYSDGMWDLAFVSSDTEDRSNMTVYCSPYNSRFHTDSTCSDIGGDAHEVSLKDALLMAKTACEICASQAAMEFYCTEAGNYYHVQSDCSGMRNANKVTYAEARVLGKKRCPTCIGGADESEQDGEEEAQAAGYYVYATAKGAYYHVNPTCSGMKNAQQVLLSDMLKQSRPACPVCCPDAETAVFAESGNPYFHSYATCSGMTQATQGILVNALAAGLTRCPVCWTASEGS